jgi:hypothetical protein
MTHTTTHTYTKVAVLTNAGNAPVGVFSSLEEGAAWARENGYCGEFLFEFAVDRPEVPVETYTEDEVDL